MSVGATLPPTGWIWLFENESPPDEHDGFDSLHALRKRGNGDVTCKEERGEVLSKRSIGWEAPLVVGSGI